VPSIGYKVQLRKWPLLPYAIGTDFDTIPLSLGFSRGC
jgi:hypothetical protein